MGTSTEVETIKAAKKLHRCSWCAEKIEPGESYKRWRWFDGGDASTVKEHPECYEAMDEAYADDPGLAQDGWTPGENPRGCSCGFSAGCDRCESKKNL